jgi:hypothetical protein
MSGAAVRSASTDPVGEPLQTLGELYDAHGPRLYRYALLILADRAAAEDAVQEVRVRSEGRGAGLRVALGSRLRCGDPHHLDQCSGRDAAEPHGCRSGRRSDVRFGGAWRG